jgi:substrate import-associated zinc metallohydrolase lipoprotein
MKSFKNIAFIACLLLIFAACKKTENLNVQQPVGLGGEVVASTTIDKWIMDSLTTPYNITALYRWDPWTASLYKTVTPADESRVIPLFSALKRVWINPYNEETGSEMFMKKYSPKQFVLIGSVEYDYYSVTLGQAEGGNNIVFFDVNQNYDKNPITSIKRVIHTAHHEFAHILHQTVMYPQDFKGTSSKLGLPGYTATWFNVSDADAFNQGYATAYSRSGPDDDFVEMVATMLTEGRPKWEEMKANTNATARQALQQKEDFVVTYYRQVWNIDFYSLQTRVQNALNALYPPPAVSDVFGFGKTYTRASVNPANTTILPQPAAFTTIFNSAKTGLAAVGGAGRVLDSFAVVQSSAATIQLRMYYRNSAGSAFQANFNYAVTKDASNVYTFTYTSADANGSVIASGVTSLTDYFSNNKFTITWYADPNSSIYPRVKFTPQATPGTYFIARLLP